ncbi:MAG TPA: HAMP domain-containing sensor histidine kinase [Solirubrobacterales bacterium]|nr:HAMP domain-containing sensor histidine kinase [Solirubrobacterales bacterium]
MPVELAEIAAGLPFAASFAMASGLTALREGRRRSALNEAVHELRRPLQALAFSLPPDPGAGEAAESALRMAAAAVDRLDREINGEAAAAPTQPVRIRPVVEAALARWRPRAAAVGRSLGLTWEAADPVVSGNETDLVQALDNLISNGFEHGSGGVEIEVCEAGGRARVAVRDGGPGNAGRSSHRPEPEPERRAPGRHGHGLKIVRRAAARHGGSFRLRRSPGGTEARLYLPLGERR